ncbi:MAG TPA: methyltransferase [Egibacteraceae bacterium]|nr:methyltransferase [Egibacteraceae bacterium]
MGREEPSGLPAPPAAGDAAFTAGLRDALEQAGYTEAGLRAVQGRDEEGPDGRPNLAYYLRRLAEPTPLHTLVRLFTLNVTVAEDEARAALAPVPLESVLASGLVEPAPGGGVRSPFAMSITGGLRLVHDPSGSAFAGIGRAHVAGVGASALTLAGVTPRRPTGRTLDLGTGSGIQALLAAPHSDTVVAVDANRRALGFTAFNAALNGVGVGTRLGDWYDPVAGERFDLIVCNPPYVISPETRYQFRDGGMPEDRLCATIVRRAAAHLTEGGVAVVLANWGHHAPGEWWEPAARWVDNLGCDAWLLHDETFEPLDYAAVWNRGRDEPAYADALDRWTAYLAGCGIVAVTAGVVLLRRRAGTRNWLRTAGPPTLAEPLGEQIARVFAAEDLLTEGDDVVRQVRLRLPADHRLEFGMRAGDGRLAVADTRLRLLRGLRSEVAVDDDVLHLLARCDGRHRVGDVAMGLAEARGEDPDVVTAAVVAVARRLLALGLAEPSPDAPTKR